MSTLGVIVGRFQTPNLHPGHIALINEVHRNNDSVAIFIGISPNIGSLQNPMDFETRRLMFQQYTSAVLPILDQPTDKGWDALLDSKISELCNPSTEVTLYGGPDSFLNTYRGKHFTVYIDSINEASFDPHSTKITSSSLRSKVIPVDSKQFREGAIYASKGKYPKVNATVDVALVKMVSGEPFVAMGTKSKEPGLRFPGGFVDREDPSLEYAAYRELIEECADNPTLLREKGIVTQGLLLGEFRYIGSAEIVHDWRAEDDVSFMTSFFLAEYLDGKLKAGDDLDTVDWYRLWGLGDDFAINIAHIELVEHLKCYITDHDDEFHNNHLDYMEETLNEN